MMDRSKREFTLLIGAEDTGRTCSEEQIKDALSPYMIVTALGFIAGKQAAIKGVDETSQHSTNVLNL
jgi:hypothetical protein